MARSWEQTLLFWGASVLIVGLLIATFGMWQLMLPLALAAVLTLIVTVVQYLLKKR